MFGFPILVELHFGIRSVPSLYIALSRSQTLEEAGQTQEKRRARHVRVSWCWDEIGITCSSRIAGEHLGLGVGSRFQNP